MIIRSITFGFAALMLLGATCNDTRSDPEVIARCIDPRRIDFDNGFRQVCDTTRALSHPIATIEDAFSNNRFSRANAFD